MTIETVPFDPTRFFKTDEAQRELIRDALATGHAGYIANVIGTVARIRGMSDVAEKSR